MKHIFKSILITFILSAFCHIPKLSAQDKPREWQVTDDLKISECRPGVWIHTSWRKLETGPRFPSNGLIVRDKDALLLVDTGWGVELTRDLLSWIDTELKLPVKLAIITHFHDDRLGGTPVLVERKIPFVALPLTISLGADAGVPLPDSLENLQVGAAKAVKNVEVFYPGPAHTEDNIVVWIPEAKVLFGGCAVRPAGTKSLGNTVDANVAAWPDAIRRMQQKYPEAEVVVPSHGPPGNRTLLSHTLELFEK